MNLTQEHVNGFISLNQLLINVMLKILQVSPDGNNWALILGSEDQGVQLGEAKGMTGRMVGV